MKPLPILIFLGHIFMSSLMAQSMDQTETTDEARIIQNWKPLQYENTRSQVISFPQRKFDSPLFCDELIPYRNGYIINSIVTSPGPAIDIRTNFYYLDIAEGSLSLLTIPHVDTIESIIPGRQAGLICSYKTKQGNVISQFIGPTENSLTIDAPPSVLAGLDTAVWIKLGYQGDKLFALTAHAAYSFANSRWDQVVLSMPNTSSPKRKYRRSAFPLPTRNILVTDSCIWFLYEIVQGRTCNLMRFDLQTGKIVDFYKWLGYTDNYHREIFDYSLLTDGSLVVASNRLMGNYMVLKALNGSAEFWTFNNSIRPQNWDGVTKAVAPWQAEDDESSIGISAVARTGDTLYFAGVNGLFRKHGDSVTTLIRWKNSHQTVEGNIDFEFVPRCLQILQDNQFLMGGVFGGLYLVDPTRSKIKCLDDLPYKKIKTIDLRTW
jgi:hypothetical protein